MIQLTIFKKWRLIVLLFIFSIFSEHIQAQFTYSGIRLSYHNVRFDKGGDFEGTRLNDFVANVDLVHRPLRNFGIGISVRVPIINGFKYQYIVGDYSDQIMGGGSSGERKVDYAGGNFEYNIQNTYSLTLMGRFYFDTEDNYFFDIRYTFENYNEALTFDRQAGSLPKENINHQEKVTVKGLGFTLGFQPKISDHFYFTYAFTVDFLGYDGTSFDYVIQKGNSGYDDYIRVKSKIDDTQTSYEFSAGVGYVF